MLCFFFLNWILMFANIFITSEKSKTQVSDHIRQALLWADFRSIETQSARGSPPLFSL